MTANLDGETSLKTKFSSKLSQQIKTTGDVFKFVGSVECENPNPKLDSFLGRMFRCDIILLFQLSYILLILARALQC